jgi:hypothetical protein
MLGFKFYTAFTNNTFSPVAHPFHARIMHPACDPARSPNNFFAKHVAFQMARYSFGSRAEFKNKPEESQTITPSSDVLITVVMRVDVCLFSLSRR